MKLSVCAEMVFGELAFCDRLREIKACGLDCIEFWRWSDKDIEALRGQLAALGMTVSAFCVDSSDPEISAYIGKYALNGDNAQALLAAAQESIQTAKYLGAKNLIITVGDRLPGIPDAQQIKMAEENLSRLAPVFAQNGVTLLVEPINRQERPAYLLPNARGAARLVNAAASPAVKLLYDIYHQSMEQDFALSHLLEILPCVGHIHVADCPGRGEPGTGGVDYPAVFREVEQQDYTGLVGLEFLPQSPAAAALRNVQALCGSCPAR